MYLPLAFLKKSPCTDSEQYPDTVGQAMGRLLISFTFFRSAVGLLETVAKYRLEEKTFVKVKQEK